LLTTAAVDGRITSVDAVLVAHPLLALRATQQGGIAGHQKVQRVLAAVDLVLHQL